MFEILGGSNRVMVESEVDHLDSNPPFFLNRRVWLAGIALAALVLLAGLLLLHSFSDGKADLLANPVVGDIYEADLSKVSTGFNDPPTYGLMKLVSITEGQLTFQVASAGYNEKTDASQDYASGAYKAADYFTADDPVSYSADELKKLRDQGTISQIDRP